MRVADVVLQKQTVKSKDKLQFKVLFGFFWLGVYDEILTKEEKETNSDKSDFPKEKLILNREEIAATGNE